MIPAQRSDWTTPTSPGGVTLLKMGGELRSSPTHSPNAPKLGIEVAGATFLTLGIVLGGTGSRSLAPATPVTSGAPAVAWSAETTKSRRGFLILSASEQILAIRSLLGLNMSELAAALQVQRPTVYSWQSGLASPHIGNANRLRRLYEQALRWRGMCAEPLGEWARKPLDDRGTTLAALVAGETLDEAAVAGALEALKVKVESSASEFASVRDRARGRGYKERSEAKKAASLDRETTV